MLENTTKLKLQNKVRNACDNAAKHSSHCFPASVAVCSAQCTTFFVSMRYLHSVHDVMAQCECRVTACLHVFKPNLSNHTTHLNVTEYGTHKLTRYHEPVSELYQIYKSTLSHKFVHGNSIYFFKN
jgi:hypothetical protein